MKDGTCNYDRAGTEFRNYDRAGTEFGIAAYQDQANSMRRSHDENGSIQMNMHSLGVMNLDLSISPDGFRC